MKSKKQNLPIIRYSITYIVLAASIILLLNLSSYVTFRSLERKYVNSNEKNVKQYIVSLEQNIKSAENNMNIMLTDDFNFLSLQLLPQQVPMNDLYRVWKTNKWLSNTFKLSRTDNFFFYFRNNDFFVSSSNVYMRFKDVYGSLFQFGQLDYKGFLDSMSLDQERKKIYPTMTIRLNKIDKSGMIYAKVIPNKYFESNVISCVFIETSYLEQLRNSILTKNHTISIFDTSGHLLYTTGRSENKTENRNNNGSITSTVHSTYGFVCRCEISRADAFSELHYLKMFVNGINFFAFLFALFYIYYNSVKNIGKIKNILESVDRHPQKISENLFDYLNYQFSRLRNDNNNLKITLGTQMDFIRTSMIDKIVSGRYKKAEELLKDMKQISAWIPTDGFCILAVSHTGNLTNKTLQQINMIFAQRGIVSNYGYNTIMALIGLDSMEFPECKNILKRDIRAMQEQIRRDTETSCLCCCSNIFEDISETAMHFDLCKNILVKYRQRTPLGDILWSCDMQLVNEKTFKQKIMEYIADNFADHNLSLQSAAEHFQFSPSYFSAMFKETMGESYSGYLENTRMKYADTLVCNTDLKIEDIAIRSGYNSSNTFLRAYKRYYGASPKIRKNILCSP